ncbi:MAG: hypothetical protein J6M17_01055 [Ruminococcus sp.]|nr:hypothetical protein [Ruminococcus sp.]
MKTKLMAAVLAAVMCLAMSACGSSAEKEDENSTAAKSETVVDAAKEEKGAAGNYVSDESDENSSEKESKDPKDLSSEEALQKACDEQAEFIKSMAESYVLQQNIAGKSIPDGTYRSGDGSELTRELEKNSKGAEFKVTIESDSVTSVHVTVHTSSGVDYESDI